MPRNLLNGMNSSVNWARLCSSMEGSRVHPRSFGAIRA
jgi:hypothetical protein